MTASKVFCFIPAKGASTRLRKKNIKKIGGKELVGFSIETALKSGLFEDHVIVSTESKEVSDVAKKFGAAVPYVRDEKLSKDPYGVKDVLLDFLIRFPEYQNFSYVVVMLPTAPFVNEEDLKGCLEKIQTGCYTSVISITPTEHNSFRSVLNNEGEIQALFEDELLKKSQELQPTFRINGACVVVDLKAFLLKKSFFLKKMGAYEMPIERSVDIDDEIGFQFAEFLYQKRNESSI